MHLVAAQPVSGTELADPGLDLVLQGLEPGELVYPSGQLLEVRDDQRGGVGTVAISFGGSLLATAGAGNAIYLWNTTTGASLGTSTRGPYWPEERITCSICSIPPRS